MPPGGATLLTCPACGKISRHHSGKQECKLQYLRCWANGEPSPDLLAATTGAMPSAGRSTRCEVITLQRVSRAGGRGSRRAMRSCHEKRV